jgi:hypothetical protein
VELHPIGRVHAVHGPVRIDDVADLFGDLPQPDDIAALRLVDQQVSACGAGLPSTAAGILVMASTMTAA